MQACIESYAQGDQIIQRDRKETEREGNWRPTIKSADANQQVEDATSNVARVFIVCIIQVLKFPDTDLGEVSRMGLAPPAAPPPFPRPTTAATAITLVSAATHTAF